MKLMGWLAPLVLLFSSHIVHAERNAIEITSVQIDEEKLGVYKTYSYNKVLDVHYSYGENMTDGDWTNKVLLSFDDYYEDLWVPVDIVKVGFSVGGDGDVTTKMLKIPDVELPEHCDLVGTAKVVLSDMWVWVPEYPAGYASGAKVVKVISSSKPKLDCSSS